MRGRALSVLLAVAAGACDRPRPIVLCHNGNCGRSDPARDDSLPALAESLALEYAGRPAIDGIEWDTFWYAAESRCLFAHDLSHDTSTPALAAATMIGDHLAATERPGWSGGRYVVVIELKPNTGPSLTGAHTPEQLVLHAGCALDAADAIIAGARAGGHPLTIGFASPEPAMHRELLAQPRWATYQGAADVEPLLIGNVFGPYVGVLPDVAQYDTPLDVVEYHPGFLTAQRREAYHSLGIDLMQWQFVTTTDALDAIERWEPRYVMTNEAVLLRRWLEL